jgi:hypothetical protein
MVYPRLNGAYSDHQERRYSMRHPDRTGEYVSNLLSLYYSATDSECIAGANWYPAAYRECEKIAKATGFNVVNVAHAMAALSPLRAWALNVRQTWDVAWAVKKERQLPACHFTRCVQTAQDCLLGDTHKLSGPKVKAFAAAILGDPDAAVIDSHMLDAMGWDRPYTPKPGGMYNALANALRLAAEAVGKDVSTFQAIVWVHIK